MTLEPKPLDFFLHFSIFLKTFSFTNIPLKKLILVIDLFLSTKVECLGVNDADTLAPIVEAKSLI